MKKIVLNILTATLLMVVCIGCGGGGDRMRMTVEGSGEVSFSLNGSGMVTVDWGDGSSRIIRELDGNRTSFSRVYSGSGRRTITITGNEITELSVGNERLTNLDVRHNIQLRRLSVSGGQLTSLDLRNNTALTNLIVGNIPLTNLDVSRNTALTNLFVSHTQLTSLDVSNSAGLTELVVGNNQLTSLDVSNNTNLQSSLRVNDNQLTASALNALFESLPQGYRRWDSWEQRYIYSHQISIFNNPGTNEANTSIASARGWVVW